MKILVDCLPETCGDCQFCADGMMMSPLGVQKPVNICTLYASLVPQNPTKEPKTINKDLSPKANDCLCAPKDNTASSILF